MDKDISYQTTHGSKKLIAKIIKNYIAIINNNDNKNNYLYSLETTLYPAKQD